MAHKNIPQMVATSIIIILQSHPLLVIVWVSELQKKKNCYIMNSLLGRSSVQNETKMRRKKKTLSTKNESTTVRRGATKERLKDYI